MRLFYKLNCLCCASVMCRPTPPPAEILENVWCTTLYAYDSSGIVSEFHLAFSSSLTSSTKFHQEKLLSDHLHRRHCRRCEGERIERKTTEKPNNVVYVGTHYVHASCHLICMSSKLVGDLPICDKKKIAESACVDVRGRERRRKRKRK